MSIQTLSWVDGLLCIPYYNKHKKRHYIQKDQSFLYVLLTAKQVIAWKKHKAKQRNKERNEVQSQMWCHRWYFCKPLLPQKDS